jgi:hypothetical protein
MNNRVNLLKKISLGDEKIMKYAIKESNESIPEEDTDEINAVFVSKFRFNNLTINGKLGC